ncbi:MAG: hypothetical protein KDD43_11785 [Bdellovibrionales bacterium]|nr:hypothetical protein [Bdellovibrionales bacterium]
MKTSLLFILIFLLPVAHAQAYFPFDEVLQYECEQAHEQREVTGFGCLISGNELQIGLLKDFAQDPAKQKAMKYQRGLLMARYAQAGGLRMVLIDLTSKPSRRKNCHREHALSPFNCTDWQEIDWKQEQGS